MLHTYTSLFPSNEENLFDQSGPGLPSSKEGQGQQSSKGVGGIHRE